MGDHRRYPDSQKMDIFGRPERQFPSKYGTLPGIGGSPVPGDNNQMVPYGATRGKLGALQSSMDGMDGDDKFRQLETRVNVAEKSNRALLDEVVRLQSELKANLRRNEEIVRDERQTQSQMENSLRASNDLIAQLSSRIKRTEEKVQEERQAVSALVNHTKSVEQAVLGSQQELMSRREMQAAKVEELRNELESTTRAKDQMERSLFNMADEMRQLKAKVDAQGRDFGQVANDLKTKAKRLEDDSRLTKLDSMRKQGENQAATEMTTAQLRGQVEQRLTELRDAVVDMRSKQEQEGQERRLLEQSVQQRLGDVQSSLNEQTRKREEAMHALEVLAREKEHAAEIERAKMQQKIAETAENVTKKILSKEMALREETQKKYQQLEETLAADQEGRMEFEKKIRDNIEEQLEAMKKHSEEAVQSLKDRQKREKSKQNDTLQKLNEGMNILEKALEENRKQMDKILAAEIKSRKHSEKELKEKQGALEEKLGAATKTLQQALGGVNSQVNSQNDKLRADLKTMIEESQGAGTRGLADLDARLTALAAKLANSENSLESKIGALEEKNKEAEELAKQAQSMREKVESILLWQSTTSLTIKELTEMTETLPKQVKEVEEKQDQMKTELDERLQDEAKSREDGDDKMHQLLKKKSVANMAEPPPATASSADIDACQGSIRKLAESLQTVKTVLGMKIQSEHKERVEEVKVLQEELATLKEKVEPLLPQPGPRIFIKEEVVEDKDLAEEEAPDINRWSIYTAYRWLRWKSRWLYPKWKQEASLASLENDNEPPAGGPRVEPGKNDAKSDSNSDPNSDSKSDAKPGGSDRKGDEKDDKNEKDKEKSNNNEDKNNSNKGKGTEGNGS